MISRTRRNKPPSGTIYLLFGKVGTLVTHIDQPMRQRSHGAVAGAEVLESVLSPVYGFFEHGADLGGQGIKGEWLSKHFHPWCKPVLQGAAGIACNEQHMQAWPFQASRVRHLPPVQAAGQAHVRHQSIYPA